MSPPLYVKSVSKIARSTIDAVGSKARWGSDVLIVNELSITSVAPAVVEADDATAATRAAPATSGSSQAARRVRIPLTVPSLR